MSISNHDRYYGSLSKSRRSSPGESQGGFFQTGQGGRTVLPPLSSAFPTSRFPVPAAYSNQYTQPRSSPGRYDLNQQALYNHWPGNTSPQPTSTFTNYETHEGYPSQPHYTTYSSRTPPIPGNQADSRKLPPLATNASAGWQSQSYVPTSSNYTVGSSIRSPTASYPTAYAGYPSSNQPSYTYHMPTQEHRHTLVPSMNPQSMSAYDGTESSRGDHHRNPSPYSRSSSHVSPPTYTPPPVSPISPDESTIKKKRKRADAAQLKVLNETYERTAFPSTEERNALAKMLDMSPRSVQIWFQNKRQSMRQTNRQTAPGVSGSQPHISGDPDQHSTMVYSDPMHSDSSYTRHAQEAPRSHTSASSSSHRRSSGREDDSRKPSWVRGY